MLKERRRIGPEQDVGLSYEMDLPARELIDALRGLSPRQRSAVVLHHAAGYPVREVAAILGSTPAAVKVHLKRGRDQLRRSLSEEP
jgi:RNA polymerase sigma factor (sigma-70 family)